MERKLELEKKSSKESMIDKGRGLVNPLVTSMILAECGLATGFPFAFPCD